jgi:hypothetical protein
MYRITATSSEFWSGWRQKCNTRQERIVKVSAITKIETDERGSSEVEISNKNIIAN